MEISFRPSFRLRGAVAAVVALLVSVSALALPRPTGNASVCPMSGDAACCCVGDAPEDSSAGCCRLSAPEEPAPALHSNASLALALPAVASRDLPNPTRVESLSGPAQRVVPRARSAPLFLLFAAFLV